MRRSITTFPLLFTSVSAILGSGWLFSVYYTAKLAGPSSLLSWILGGLAVIVVAFVYAEICSMLPIMGASVRIPQYSHGTITGFFFSWMTWLAYASLPPVEVQGVIQYLSFYMPDLIHANGGLTGSGYIAAAILMVIVSIINMYSLKWLVHCNSGLTVMKIIIPLFVAITILIFFFTPSRMTNPDHTSFFPFGVSGMFEGISIGGIIFAFYGFKQACEMAGEAKNPHISVPIAVIGSVSICLLIYILLEASFLSSLQASNLLGGWGKLRLDHKASPIVAIIEQDQLNWMIPIVYIGAIIAPFASSLMYTGSAARSMYGLSKNVYLPHFLQILTKKGMPFYAILINFIFGMSLFAPLPGWDRMVSFLTSVMAITYAIAPVALLSLRKQLPDKPRPFKLPIAYIWTTIAFYFCTIFTYWSGWNVISKFSLALLAGAIIFFIYHYVSPRGREHPLDWKASIWIWPYFIGITLFSYLGKPGGGKNIIPEGWDYLVIFVFSCCILLIAYLVRLPTKKTEFYLKELGVDIINQ